jgi:SAM-dependent methyltransferase
LPSTVDSYHVAAKHYDGAYASMRDLVDMPFYLALAKEIGGPVLEIGCGTGRVLLPIARAGIEIHGLDNSGPMLGVLEENLDRESKEVRGRVTLHSGDMRDFRLNQTFALVTIPFRPMQHMHTLEDQISALKSARAHLNDGGILAFDVFYPKFEVLHLGIGEERLEAEWSPSTDSQTIIRRYYRKDAVDKINQNFTLTFIFRNYRDGKLIREENDSIKMSYYTYPQLRALFLLAGLEPVAEYGSFDKTPLDNSSTEMIFLLRRAHG